MYNQSVVFDNERAQNAPENDAPDVEFFQNNLQRDSGAGS